MKSLAELRPLPDELRDNWGRAYQFWHVNSPSGVYVSDMERLQSGAGITDRLIVAVLERALSQRKPHAIAWTKTVLEGLVPYGIRTEDEWRAFEAEQAATKTVPPDKPTSKATSSLQRAMEKALKEEGQ